MAQVGEERKKYKRRERNPTHPKRKWANPAPRVKMSALGRWGWRQEEDQTQRPANHAARKASTWTFPISYPLQVPCPYPWAGEAKHPPPEQNRRTRWPKQPQSNKVFSFLLPVKPKHNKNPGWVFLAPREKKKTSFVFHFPRLLASATKQLPFLPILEGIPVL